MKQLTCEMCGSTNLLKKDGVFVCQDCGTQYSVEEAKKIMVEGVVEVTGTVKVDSSDKLGNYLMMAKNAYDADNKKEAESYCNKIIEIDPNNYEAWYIKGKAAGWQSTLANIRIEESVNCFTKAIESAPEDKAEEIKTGSADEIRKLSLALVSLCCDNYSKNASEKNAKEVKNSAILVQLWALKLLAKCGVQPKSFKSDMATKINQAVLKAFRNDIQKDYHSSAHPSEHAWERFTKQSWDAVDLLKYAITLREKEDEAQNKDVYETLIVITKAIESSGKYTYSNGGWSKIGWNKDYKEKLINQIMEYHNKIKEIDPEYVIPERPQPSSNGCYVATAVYGSYDCPEVWTLRRYRDDHLAATWAGRAFIHTYYAVSPTLVRWFGHTDWFKKLWKGKLDRMVQRLNAEGVQNTPYNDKNW